MEPKQYALELGNKAKSASRRIALLSSEIKNEWLNKLALKLEEKKSFIQEENKKDLKAGEDAGLSSAMLDRLTLSDKRFDSMISGLHQIASLPDPVGEIVKMWKRPNGMEVGKMRVPLGVIGIIFESRPNVTIDAAALCFKSGNASILRGGKEAIHSNLALAEAMKEVSQSLDISPYAVQMVDTPDRNVVSELLHLDEYIDVIVPRGGEGLIRAVVEQSTIPVIKHYKGVCHVYVDEFADTEKAISIAFNAKVQRPGVCNSMETLLVHKSRIDDVLKPLLLEFKEAGVEVRGCQKTQSLSDEVKPASGSDWPEEFLDLILAVKIVDSMDEAIDHIAKYGSAHTDAIVTRDWDNARKFVRSVDSSSVMVNVSTRFSDGFEYGLGAEIGISTDKLHARGPMGLEELTCTKFIVFGEGQIRK